MRLLRAFAALVLMAFALTGCMKIEMNLSITEQDTINGSMVFAIEKPVLAMSGKAPEDSFGAIASEVKDLPKGSRSEVYDDGKFYGRKIIFENMPFSEFNRPNGPMIVHKDNVYTFTMDADMSKMELGPQAALVTQVLETLELRIEVTFPGKVIERDNLAELNGNTVSWRIKFGSGHQLRAVSEEPGTLQWILLAGVGGLFGILVVIGIVVLAIRLNRKPAPSPSPPDTRAQPATHSASPFSSSPADEA